MKKLCRLLLRHLAKDIGFPVIKGDDAIQLPSSELVRNELHFRCVEERDLPDRVWIEVRFIVKISAVANLWVRYSGRVGARPNFTCSQQIRRATYPEYALPESGFSLSVDCADELDRFIKTLSVVVRERLVPLAQTCSNLNGVCKAISDGNVSAQRFDYALILALTDRKDEALIEICDAKKFFEAPENGFEQGNMMLRMFDELQKELESPQGIS